MDKLIRFVIDAAGTVLVLLAGIGFAALCAAMGYILYLDICDFLEDKNGKA